MVIWNAEPLMLRGVGFDDNVTAHLVDEAISPVTAQGLHQMSPTEVSG